ncbi:polysaccharide deacetylase family protein [Alteribacter keqinensis]|uniref:Polysaccharide deacetylase family protein n=1 Tax=Alteribacter keqinensis TaxID=2483800 RepID=A0A3M7TTU5_9BACI|nr:polysaccharide deacetylase family protein [Alteribacter keqinensis]RNA67773.1 polysaccharide deacetylase family protein [Alteribacter keqinensis]
MRIMLVNALFLLTFVFFFSSIVNYYYDDFATAMDSNSGLFTENKSIDLNDTNQGWGRGVRDFKVDEGSAAPEIPVLLYHRILDDNDIQDHHYNKNGELYKTITLKSQFEKQMDLLAKEDFVTLTSKEFELFMRGEIDLPEKSVLITFDDGFKDNHIEAYPILKEHQFTALNFVITGYIDESDSEYEPAHNQYLSISDIMAATDVFEYYSHTYNFHHQNEKGVAYLISEPISAVKKDIEISVNNLNNRSDYFAYPYGAYNNKTADLLEEMDFKMAFTSDLDKARPDQDPYRIPRIEISNRDDIEDFKEKIGLEKE